MAATRESERGLPSGAEICSACRCYTLPPWSVVQVDGELDMLTAPLLDACLRKQLTHALPHYLAPEHNPLRR